MEVYNIQHLGITGICMRVEAKSTAGITQKQHERKNRGPKLRLQRAGEENKKVGQKGPIGR